MISEKPDAVIHLAAASDPNYCQTHPEETFKINVTASSNIAGLCSDLKAACVFTSSDQVFDGKSPPYKENDDTNPLNIYGQQKGLPNNRCVPGMKMLPSVECRLCMARPPMG